MLHVAIGVSLFDDNRLTLDVAELLEPRTKPFKIGPMARPGSKGKKADDRYLGARLREGTKRHGKRRARGYDDEFPPSHAITSSGVHQDHSQRRLKGTLRLS